MFHTGILWFIWVIYVSQGCIIVYMDTLCCFACLHCASCGCIMFHTGASFHIVHYISYGYVIFQWVQYVCMVALSFTQVHSFSNGCFRWFMHKLFYTGAFPMAALCST